ncbi:unnamed protein product [Blepharisma stoltei]|uniref:Uncharacterized protein n=1 Tax=Blepharisma stoltei TaxID=1481888 RepID=A0AAU9J0S3_9CILI|nr:unnamed protein product [Blepharisma stoltei]
MIYRLYPLFSRPFSKFARISEYSHLPRKIAYNLEAISKLDTSNPKNASKLLKLLQDTDKKKKKSLALPKVDFATLPAIRLVSSKLISIIENYDFKSLIKIIRECSHFNIMNEELWQAFEKSIMTTHYNSIDSKNIYGVVQVFSTSRKGSPEFWNKLEEIIVERVCPLHSMRASTVAVIMYAFKKLHKLNEKILLILEQQVLRTSDELDGVDASRILYTFAQHKLGSDDLYRGLIKRIEETTKGMTAYDFTIILSGLVKANKGNPKIYSDIENLLITKGKKDITIQNVSGILNAYARYMSPKLLEQKTDFLNQLRDVLVQFKSKLKYEADLTILHIIYGLNHLNINDNEELSKILLDIVKERNIKSKPEFQNFLKDINKYLK